MLNLPLLKRSFAVALIVLLAITATAYKTQKGYVKTRGRLTANGKVIAGKRLPNAVVILRNSNNTRSDANGNFSVTVPAQNFYLQNVKKEGRHSGRLWTYACRN